MAGGWRGEEKSWQNHINRDLDVTPKHTGDLWDVVKWVALVHSICEI